MKIKTYTLSSCDTSKRILSETGITKENSIIRDIKSSAINPAELDEMKALSGSYESLFSRRAKKYKSLSLKDKMLSESDYRDLILKEYTFLKRPVVIIGDNIFIGNSKKNVMSLKEAINRL